MNPEQIRVFVEHQLGVITIDAVLKGRGMCNNVYLVTTQGGDEIVVKEERPDKETDEQNDLMVEGGVMSFLTSIEPILPIPKVLFISDRPKLLGYQYIEGDLMIDVWKEMTEGMRTDVCRSIGIFHGALGRLIDEAQANKLGLQIDKSTGCNTSELKRYKEFMDDPLLPLAWKKIATKAVECVHTTTQKAHFQCIHNDLHHENILIHDGKLVGAVDFGDCEFSDVHREFCYSVQHYPDYYPHMVDSYEQSTGISLSKQRVISYAVIRDMGGIMYYFHHPDEEARRPRAKNRINVKDRMTHYADLFESL